MYAFKTADITFTNTQTILSTFRSSTNIQNKETSTPLSIEYLNTKTTLAAKDADKGSTQIYINDFSHLPEYRRLLSERQKSQPLIDRTDNSKQYNSYQTSRKADACIHVTTKSRNQVLSSIDIHCFYNLQIVIQRNHCIN